MSEYLSPERAIEIEAMEAIVKAKMRSGYQYRQSIHNIPKSGRLEWIVNQAMQPRRKLSTPYSTQLKQKGDGSPDMAMSDESFESLWAFCTKNARLFPTDWGTLYYMLANKMPDDAGRWTPPLPLSLSGWFCIFDMATKEQLQMRFKRHIEWARDHSQLAEIGEYLRSLTEGEWLHFDEL